MITLYHHGSSACAAKVRFALAEKNIDWDGQYIDILSGEQFDDNYLKINPKGVVPALVHDDLVVTESSLICEYLEDAFPDKPLLPDSPQGRLNVRYWTKAVDEELHPSCSALTYVVSHRHTLIRNGLGDYDEFLKKGGSDGRAARELKWKWIQQGVSAPGVKDKILLYLSYLDKMECALKNSEWLVGDQFSLADVALAPYLNRLSALAMEGVWQGGRLPRVADWFDRIKERNSFQSAIKEWVPQALQDEMLQNGKKSWPEIQAIMSVA